MHKSLCIFPNLSDLSHAYFLAAVYNLIPVSWTDRHIILLFMHSTKTLIMLDKIFTLGLLLTTPIFASCHCHCHNGGHFLSHVINYPLNYKRYTTMLVPSCGGHHGGCSIYSGAGIQGYYPKGHGQNYGRYYDTSYYHSDSSAEAAAAASTLTSNSGSSSTTAASEASASRGSSGIISYGHGPKCGGYYETSYYYPSSGAESAASSSTSASNSGSSSVADATATSATRGSSGIISYGHGPKCGGYYDTSYNYPGSSAESAAPASSASTSNSGSSSVAEATATSATKGSSDSSSAASTSTASAAGEYQTTSYEYSSSSTEAIPAASTTEAISSVAPSSVANTAAASFTGVGKDPRPPFYGADPGWGWGWGGYYVKPLLTKIPKYYSIHPIYGGQKPYIRWGCWC
uniref:Uncharacterized protein n=1 Tax=Timema shepardi TaxID=629360 RepID=A0A7R9B139_TIMSH|nr:unnamed protein product [Timema shepardi]